MRHRCEPRHDVGFKRIVRSARKFEHAGRLLQQAVQTFARPVVRHVRPVPLMFEWQDGVKLKAHFERDGCRDLVGPIGQR